MEVICSRMFCTGISVLVPLKYGEVRILCFVQNFSQGSRKYGNDIKVSFTVWFESTIWFGDTYGVTIMIPFVRTASSVCLLQSGQPLCKCEANIDFHIIPINSSFQN